MLLNSCANSAVEAEGYFKSVKVLNHIITQHSKAVPVTCSGITHSRKVMAETIFVAFPLHFISLPPLLQHKHHETDSVFHQGLVFSCENKAYEEGGSTSDVGHCGLSGHARKKQAGRFCHHCFLLKCFCSNTVSLH